VKGHPDDLDQDQCKNFSGTELLLTAQDPEGEKEGHDRDQCRSVDAKNTGAPPGQCDQNKITGCPEIRPVGFEWPERKPVAKPEEEERHPFVENADQFDSAEFVQ
jgi:hypothetical protein